MAEPGFPASRREQEAPKFRTSSVMDSPDGLSAWTWRTWASVYRGGRPRCRPRAPTPRGNSPFVHQLPLEGREGGEDAGQYANYRYRPQPPAASDRWTARALPSPQTIGYRHCRWIVRPLMLSLWL